MLIISCSRNEFKNVGDIPFDSEIDDNNFELCDEDNIKQYYVRNSSDTPPNYQGEKRGLENTILEKYSFPKSERENGYVTIRFFVNCKGLVGRLRIEEMSFAYEKRSFDKKLTNQLLRIVQNLNHWAPRKDGSTSYDFYQYITFKLDNGQISKILP
jgi:hypothetical protein